MVPKINQVRSAARSTWNGLTRAATKGIEKSKGVVASEVKNLEAAAEDIVESQATQQELNEVLKKTGIEVNGQIVGKYSGITASGDVVDLKNIAESATEESEKLAAKTVAEEAATKPNEVIRQTKIQNETNIASDKLMLEQELETNKASVAAKKQREVLDTEISTNKNKIVDAQTGDYENIYNEEVKVNNDIVKRAEQQSQDKAAQAAEQAAGTTEAATGGGQLAGNNPTPPDASTDGRFKVGAGWVMGGVIGGAGLTYALMRNRGQQTNAQLYGQQPLY